MTKLVNDFIYGNFEECYPLFYFNEDGYKFPFTEDEDIHFPSEANVDNVESLIFTSMKNVIDSEVTDKQLCEYLLKNVQVLTTDLEEVNKKNLYYIIERVYGYLENNFVINVSVNPTIDLKMIILTTIFNFIKSFPLSFTTYLLTLSKNEIETLSKISSKYINEPVYPSQTFYKSILKICVANQQYSELIVNLSLQPKKVVNEIICQFTQSNIFENFLLTLSKYITFVHETPFLSKDDLTILNELKNNNIIDLSQATNLLIYTQVEEFQKTLTETCTNYHHDDKQS